MNSRVFFHPKNDYTGSTRVLANNLESDTSKDSVTVITDNSKMGFLSNLPNVHIINIWQPTFQEKPIKVLSFICYILNATILALFVGYRFNEFFINTTQPFYAAIIGRLLRKKITYHVHEVFPLNTKSKKLIRCVFERTTAHRIFVSYYTKEQYPCNPKCTWEVKYNKLPYDFIEKVRITPIDKRARKNVLMIASLTKAKGILNYVDVARHLPDYMFCLVLSAEKNEINHFFGDDIPSNVSIFPSQSDVHPFLEKTDLILNMSIPFLCVETFGLTILEAMPYGIPAIVPNVGGPTEIILNGVNGYCVDVTDTNAVVTAITEVLDENNYLTFVENTLKRYNEQFK